VYLDAILEISLMIASALANAGASCWQALRGLPHLAEKIPENLERPEKWW